MHLRRTKIICTIGPSCDTYDKIRALIKAGMDVARLNFSHGTHEKHAAVIPLIRKAALELKKPVAILQDLQGPKIRVQTFEQGKIQLKPGNPFTLTTRNIPGNEKIASVTHVKLHKDVAAGDTILLNDGLINLKVMRVLNRDVQCRVVFGGMLSDHKGMNIPGKILSVEALTPKDKNDLAFGLKNHVDYIALSFVQRPEDIKKIKTLIAAYGAETPVIAKIEKPQAVEKLDAISDLADAVMVARGDLGVEVNVEEVPPIQKQMIALCNRKGVPVITATQMLESMMQYPRPTRAEASDVANAVMDGSDAVMLSGETASGLFPLEAVTIMNRIVCLIEEKMQQHTEPRRRRIEQQYPTALAIGHSACDAAECIKAATIVCLTQSGTTARMIARFRPTIPIIAVSPRNETLNRMALYWGVRGYTFKEFADNIDHAIKDVTIFLKKEKLVKPGDRIVTTAGLPLFERRNTNMLRIDEIKKSKRPGHK
jgi:pyruvate kinase